ncbi:hypothetical protein BsWGS_04454 [Bradybaena similaris]
MSIIQTTILFLILAVAWKTLPNLFTCSTTATYGGHVHPDFQEVKDVFGKNIESGREPGAAFAVYHNGIALVDLWGGQADPEAKRSWQNNTVTQVWSCTKGVVAVIMGMLVDRGLLDYAEYVHKYWPEFRRFGKENVTLGMLLSHQAGLISLDRQISLLEYRDSWPEVEQLMVKAKPAWPPGTRYSYHAYTYGMFADAVVRKVDTKHRNISQFFKEEIAELFDIDFHVGLPPELHYRVARASFTPVWELLAEAFLLRPSRWKWMSELLPGSTIHRSMNVFDIMNDMNVMNDPELQSIGVPSAVGFGTARSLAQLYDYLAHGGIVQGRQLLSKRQVGALSTPVTENIPVIGVPDAPFAMGTGVDKGIQGQLIFGHRGYGGQNAFADPGYGIGVAYITNFNSRFSESDDPRAADLLRVFYKCMQKYSLRSR